MDPYATIFWFCFFVLLLFLLILLPLGELVVESSHPRARKKTTESISSVPPTIVVDRWTTSQEVEAPANQSVRSQVEGKGILGNLRSVILLAPVGAPSSLSISSGSVIYSYQGIAANGFQIGWLPVSEEEETPLNLSSYQHFVISVTQLSTPIVLQMDVLDTQKHFSSVFLVISDPGTYTWPFRSFLDIDFSSIQSLQLEGDIRAGPGQTTFGPLTIQS